MAMAVPKRCDGGSGGTGEGSITLGAVWQANRANSDDTAPATNRSNSSKISHPVQGERLSAGKAAGRTTSQSPVRKAEMVTHAHEAASMKPGHTG